jgi:1-piperideine-2-carboxylate/1-pyrroline-2-carboxylate reductase [NAD(P)H]
VVHHFAQSGHIVVDTTDATHEAGDLLQAQINVPACITLQQCLATPQPSQATLFKSCGWAGWDLAAARLARQQV